MVLLALALAPQASLAAPATLPDSLTIEVQHGSNGTISPDDFVMVARGGNAVFNIVPDDCYDVYDVVVDDASIGAPSTYTFTNVQSDHFIYAQFQRHAYTITATADPGGAIIPSGAVSVPCGTDAMFEIQAPCTVIAQVVVDGASVGSVSSYTFSDVRGDHTIQATFTARTGSVDLAVFPTTGRCDVPDTLVAHIVGGSSGTVVFYDAGVQIGNVGLIGDTATLVVNPPLPAGPHTLTASYSGQCFTATSPPVSYPVQTSIVASPRLVMSVTPNPVEGALPVQISATLYDGASPLGWTGGAVVFFDSTAGVGAASVVNGTATLMTPFARAGSHTLTAHYGGVSCFLPASSDSVTLVVVTVSTSVSVSSSANPAPVGQALAIDAVVEAHGVVASWAGGQMSFFDGATPLGVVIVNSGRARLTISSLSVGSHAINVAYSGDPLDFPSSGSLTQVVHLPLSMSISSTANPVMGLSVLITAHVLPTNVTGTVTFSDPSGPVGTVPLVAASASLLYRAAAFGSVTITASYSGDSIYAPKSLSFVQQFMGRASSIDLESSSNPAVAGVPFTLTARVTPTNASGSVTFYDPSPIGVVPLVNGVASLPWVIANQGTRFLEARYSGDTTFVPSSISLNLLVLGVVTHTALVSSANPSGTGSWVGFTATVSPPTTLGTVTFYIDGVPQATLGLTGSAAMYATPTLSAGTHTVYTFYSGAPGLEPSISPTIQQVVVPYGGPLLRVLAPNGGETWLVGSQMQIKWAVVGDSASRVSLFVSRSLSANWELIDDNVRNTGSYAWTVTGPGTNSGPTPFRSALISIVDLSGQLGSDASDLPFSIFDLATETTVTRFDAEPLESGVRLSWSLGAGSMFARLELQRAPAATGPWADLAVEPSQQDERTIADDRTAEPGRTYWYRLVGTSSDGGHAMFGPVQATAGGSLELALSLVSPNPSHGAMEFLLSLPREAQVRLSVLDVQGRAVAVLADGAFPAGGTRVRWDGRGARGAVAAGVYLLHCEALGQRLVRRLVVIR